MSVAWLVLVVVMARLLRFAAIVGFDLGPTWYERPPPGVIEARLPA
jgi:hypothetical protein